VRWHTRIYRRKQRGHRRQRHRHPGASLAHARQPGPYPREPRQDCRPHHSSAGVLVVAMFLSCAELILVRAGICKLSLRPGCCQQGMHSRQIP
jgi:hypothetical protein